MRGQWICFAFLAIVIGNFVLSFQDEEPRDTSSTAAGECIDRRNGNCGNCGISPVGKTLIVNGDIVRPINKFPWMVALYLDGKKHCGGSIISENFIMTAAHCVERPGVSPNLDTNTSVFQNGRGGAYYFNEDEVTILFLNETMDRSPGRKVAEIIPHPYYQPDRRSVENDIALIRMSNIIKCGQYATPICLPSPAVKVGPGMIVGVAGWGHTTDPNDEGDDRLRATQIEVEKPNNCGEVLGFTPRSSICLSGKGFSSPCFGDSGGPAFIQRNNKFFAIGVASAISSKQCKPSKPVIYTAVVNYVKWIRKVSGVDFEN